MERLFAKVTDAKALERLLNEAGSRTELENVLNKLPEGTSVEGKTFDSLKAEVEQVTNSPFDQSGKLKPNVKYKTGEFNYNAETDKLGRIKETSTDNLQLTERECGER